MEEILKRSEVSTSFVELAWMSKEQRQSWNLLEPRSFDVYKNAAILMMAILGYSEIYTEISNIDIETIESNDCREMLGDDRDANSVLAMMWKGVRFFCKDG